MEVNKIYNMDCLVGMKQMADNSVDTIITDPPYGLKFMGKKWDYEIPSVEMFKEMFRVAKSGAFLLCFGGTRTWHRIAVNIEDAGFEIRDTICWLYGSGFPKSYNIGKGVDEKLGNEREFIEGGRIATGLGGERMDGGKANPYYKYTKGSSEWEGYGTALKPAFEPIIVAMKPTEGTFVENALKYGVAGLNIDGGRISHNEPEKTTNRTPRIEDNIFSDNSCGFKKEVNHIASASPLGRFPANLILNEESALMLDAQSGISTSSKVTSPLLNIKGNNYGRANGNTDIITERGHNDKGGASRFFYCAKASKSERNKGCEELEEKNLAQSNKFTDVDYRKGDGEITVKPQHNFHPTVKPIALMKYLCTLTKTPTGGIVLDPFSGSGTTAVACIQTGRKYIGFELNPDYVKIAEARINEAQPPIKAITEYNG